MSQQKLANPADCCLHAESWYQKAATLPSRSLLLALILSSGCSLVHAAAPDCGTPPCPPQPKNSPQARPPKTYAPLSATTVPHGGSSTYPTTTSHKPLLEQARQPIGPGSPGPTRTVTGTTSTSQPHGGPYGGGKSALNTQPIPPGHAMTNPNGSPDPKFNTTTPVPAPPPTPIQH